MRFATKEDFKKNFGRENWLSVYQTDEYKRNNNSTTVCDCFGKVASASEEFSAVVTNSAVLKGNIELTERAQAEEAQPQTFGIAAVDSVTVYHNCIEETKELIKQCDKIIMAEENGKGGDERRWLAKQTNLLEIITELNNKKALFLTKFKV